MVFVYEIDLLCPLLGPVGLGHVRCILCKSSGLKKDPDRLWFRRKSNEERVSSKWICGGTINHQCVKIMLLTQTIVDLLTVCVHSLDRFVTMMR